MKILLCGLILVLSTVTQAAEKTDNASVVGKQTRDALELQRSGRAASTTERPMSGDIAERTQRRYAESFSQPIPESFKDQEQEFVQGAD